jgi:four helix bundle protein
LRKAERLLGDLDRATDEGAMTGFPDHQLPYEKLRVWHSAKELAKMTYSITGSFPPSERFGLTSQINRAAVSVMSNIAEGSSRGSRKDQAHFSEIAYGSLLELACQLQLAHELRYFSDELLRTVRKDIFEVSAMLNALRNSQLKQMDGATV